MHEQSTPLSEAQRTTGRRRPWPWMNGAERFWWYVAKDGPLPMRHPGLGPCWIWTGGLRAGGYGAFNACKNATQRKHKARLRAEYNEALKTNPDLPRPSTLRR